MTITGRGLRINHRYPSENNSPDIDINALVEAGRLESAQTTFERTGIAPDRQRINARLASLNHQAVSQRSAGEIHKARRIERRVEALKIFRDHGLDPDRLIRLAILPAGYAGKILLVIISGPRVESRVCLRSGDDWHREILKNTIDEMADLGFEHITVTPAGGAKVQPNRQHEIILYGGSDDYGVCDMRPAANLITALFPEIPIRTVQ